MFIDLLIILLIICGGIIGATRGFTKQIVTVVGFVLVLVLSFLFKDMLANILLNICPFFKFNDLTSLNILLYESLALLILVCIFSSILNILINLTSMFERFLKATIVLGFASKILGFILGCIEYVAISFIILTLFSVRVDVSNSRFANYILNHTPGLSHVCNDMTKTIKEINELKEKYDDDKEHQAELNYEMLDLMVNNKLISKEKVDELINKGKLKM